MGTAKPFNVYNNISNALTSSEYMWRKIKIYLGRGVEVGGNSRESKIILKKKKKKKKKKRRRRNIKMQQRKTILNKRTFLVLVY